MNEREAENMARIATERNQAEADARRQEKFIYILLSIIFLLLACNVTLVFWPG